MGKREKCWEKCLGKKRSIFNYLTFLKSKKHTHVRFTEKFLIFVNTKLSHFYVCVVCTHAVHMSVSAVEFEDANKSMWHSYVMRTYVAENKSVQHTNVSFILSETHINAFCSDRFHSKWLLG